MASVKIQDDGAPSSSILIIALTFERCEIATLNLIVLTLKYIYFNEPKLYIYIYIYIYITDKLLAHINVRD